MSPPNRVQIKSTAIAVMSLVVLGIYLFWPTLRFLLAISQHGLIRERVVFDIPDCTSGLEHSRIGAAMCEYHRDVTFRNASTPKKTTPLKYDTAGGYPINVYLIRKGEKSFVRLDDAVAEHLLDLEAQKTYLVVSVDKKAYIGELTSEHCGYGWSMMNKDLSTREVRVCDQMATLMTDLTGNGPELYLGHLTRGTGNLRFVPASEASEAKIEYLYPLDRMR